MIISAIVLVSCEPESTSNLKQDFDRTNEVIELKVVWYDSIDELNRVRAEYFGDDGLTREGFAIWANPSREPKWCEIHTMRPQNPDDVRMDIQGHELTHCLIGNFHEEPH